MLHFRKRQIAAQEGAPSVSSTHSSATSQFVKTNLKLICPKPNTQGMVEGRLRRNAPRTSFNRSAVVMGLPLLNCAPKPKAASVLGLVLSQAADDDATQTACGNGQ